MSNRQKSGAPVGSLLSLIEFLGNHNQAEKYDYSDTANCLNCQYFRAMTRRAVTCDTRYVRWMDDRGSFQTEPLPPHFDEIARGGAYYGQKGNHTYGHALKRALEFSGI